MATIDYKSAVKIVQQPLVLNNYKFKILESPTGLTETYDTEAISSLLVPAPLSLPTREREIINVEVGKHTIPFSGGTETKSGDLEVTFVETEDLIVSKYFSAIQNLQYSSTVDNITGTSLQTSEIKMKFAIEIFKTDGETLIATYTFHDAIAFYQGLGDGSLDANSTDGIQIAITFNYGRCSAETSDGVILF